MYKYLQLNKKQTLFQNLINLIRRIGIEKLDQIEVDLFYKLYESSQIEKINEFVTLIKKKYIDNHLKQNEYNLNFRTQKNKNSFEKIRCLKANFIQQKQQQQKQKINSSNNNVVKKRLENKPRTSQIAIFTTQNVIKPKQTILSEINGKKAIFHHSKNKIIYEKQFLNLNTPHFKLYKEIKKIPKKIIKGGQKIETYKKTHKSTRSQQYINNHRSQTFPQQIITKNTINKNNLNSKMKIKNNFETIKKLVIIENSQINQDKISSQSIENSEEQNKQFIKNQKNVLITTESDKQMQKSEIFAPKKKRKMLDIQFWVIPFYAKFDFEKYIKQQDVPYIIKQQKDSNILKKRQSLLL